MNARELSARRSMIESRHGSLRDYGVYRRGADSGVMTADICVTDRAAFGAPRRCAATDIALASAASSFGFRRH